MSSTVELVGRLGKVVDHKVLPSGDQLTTFSVVVDRKVSEQIGRTTFDTIPCQTSRVSLASKVIQWEAGTEVIAQGVLRRRFWRSESGLGSALEVDVRALKKA